MDVGKRLYWNLDTQHCPGHQQDITQGQCATNTVKPQLCTLSLSAQGWQKTLRLNSDRGFCSLPGSTDYRERMGERISVAKAKCLAVEACRIRVNKRVFGPLQSSKTLDG